MRRLICAVACLIVYAGAAAAQGRTFTLAADAALVETGLLDFVVPRFALKHGIRAQVIAGDAAALAAGADLVIADRETADGIATNLGSRPRAVFHTDADPSVSYAMLDVPDSANADHAARFADWLRGEIGQRTVASFAADGQPGFLPGALKVAVETVAEPTGDANAGERLALFHCGRCHVVSEKNRMGGIGSTPSFAALRAIPGWQDKFLAFWSANPHPSFTQVEGLTKPFDPDFPPHIAPVEITQEDIESIFAYAATIAPKDLGAPISNR